MQDKVILKMEENKKFKKISDELQKWIELASEITEEYFDIYNFGEKLIPKLERKTKEILIQTYFKLWYDDDFHSLSEEELESGNVSFYYQPVVIELRFNITKKEFYAQIRNAELEQTYFNSGTTIDCTYYIDAEKTLMRIGIINSKLRKQINTVLKNMNISKLIREPIKDYIIVERMKKSNTWKIVFEAIKREKPLRNSKYWTLQELFDWAHTFFEPPYTEDTFIFHISKDLSEKELDYIKDNYVFKKVNAIEIV